MLNSAYIYMKRSYDSCGNMLLITVNAQDFSTPFTYTYFPRVVLLQWVCGVPLWSLLSLSLPFAPWQTARPGSPVATRWRAGRRWCRSRGSRSSQTAAMTRSSLPTSQTATQVGSGKGLIVNGSFQCTAFPDCLQVL